MDEIFLKLNKEDTEAMLKTIKFMPTYDIPDLRFNFYIIKEGDTYDSIKKEFEREDFPSWDKLAEAFKLNDPFNLPIGKKIIVPYKQNN